MSARALPGVWTDQVAHDERVCRSAARWPASSVLLQHGLVGDGVDHGVDHGGLPAAPRVYAHVGFRRTHVLGAAASASPKHRDKLGRHRAWAAIGISVSATWPARKLPSARQFASTAWSLDVIPAHVRARRLPRIPTDACPPRRDHERSSRSMSAARRRRPRLKATNSTNRGPLPWRGGRHNAWRTSTDWIIRSPFSAVGRVHREPRSTRPVSNPLSKPTTQVSSQRADRTYRGLATSDPGPPSPPSPGTRYR